MALVCGVVKRLLYLSLLKTPFRITCHNLLLRTKSCTAIRLKDDINQVLHAVQRGTVLSKSVLSLMHVADTS